MEYDPVVEEVRALARQREDECGNDLDRYCEHLRTVQKQYADRLITQPLSHSPQPQAVNQ